LLAQEIGGVAVFFLEKEDEQRSAVDLLRAGRRRMNDGSLHDAVEPDGGLRLDGFLTGDWRKRLAEDLVEIAAQLRQIDAAAAKQLARLRVFDQRVKKVFEANQIVTAIRCQTKGAPDALQRLGGKWNGGSAHARCSSGSGSIVTSNGYSCCSASRRVALTLVSATSRV
jgi:hypothetical protein